MTPQLKTDRKLLRAFRKQYGITLVQFGKMADISQPMLSQFERGERDLSQEAWARVVKAIHKLMDEDQARREAKRDKAGRIAEKLGVRGPFAQGLRFIGEALAALGQPELQPSELGPALEMLHMFGPELPSPDPSNLGRALTISATPYGTIADAIVKQRAQQAGLKRIAKLERSIETEKLRVLALDELQKDVQRSIGQEAERKRQLSSLENLQSLDDPIISELIESFRREIAQREKEIETLNRVLEKNDRTART